MNTLLTEDQVQAYQRDGYLLIEDFLTEKELDFWRTAVTEAIAERGGRKMPNKDIKVGEDDGQAARGAGDLGEGEELGGEHLGGLDDLGGLQAAVVGVDLGHVGTLVVVAFGFIGRAAGGEEGRGGGGDG